ncbi:MAG: J domain-containing protein [Thaumarchaeota archaeon]|nr:J domain-containing protein [Nitrososphaerota archaeon]
MSNSDDEKTYYETLGLSPNATLDQVKSRYRELNDAYLKILELSRRSANTGTPSRPTSADNSADQPKPQPNTNPKQRPSHPQETRTEPIATIKAKLARGEIQKAQFEKLAKERYNYLKNKPFSELSESEFEERLHGFEGLKFL